MKYCSKCGKELFDEAVICVGCGCPVESHTAKKTDNNEYNRLMTFVQEVKSVYALGVVSLVLCLGIGIIFQLINLPKINKYWNKSARTYVFPEFELTNSHDIQMYADAKRKFKQGKVMTSIGFGISIGLIFFAVWFGLVMPALL